MIKMYKEEEMDFSIKRDQYGFTKKVVILFMTVLLFMLSTSVFALAAGNDEASATDITGSKGQVISDKFVKETPQNQWYKFKAADFGNNVYSFTLGNLDSSVGALELYVTDTYGKTVVSATSIYKADSKTAVAKLTPNETYYIKIRKTSTNASCNYKLSFDYRQEEPDTQATAQAISDNCSKDAAVDCPYDVDYYKFTTPNYDLTYSVTFTNKKNCRYLAVEDESGVKKLSFDVSTANAPTNKSVKLTKNTTYYIRVYGSGTNYGPYSFKIAPDADEPDEMSAAKAINLNESVTGRIALSGDIDYFKFTTTGNNDYYTLNFINSSMGGTGYLRLFDELGVKKAEVSASKGKSGAKSMSLERNTTYYCQVSCNYVGDYSIRVSNSPDVANSISEAQEVAPDTAVSGSIEYPSDVDYYKLQSFDGQMTYTINFNNVNADCILATLVDSDEQETKRIELEVTKANTKTGTISLEGNKNYYLKVRCHNSSYTGDYSFNYSAVSTGNDGQTDSLNAFADRLYSLVLGREADEAGRTGWVNDLKSKKKTGTDVCFGFFFSPEMNARAVPNEEFVRIAYRVMMDREADDDGLAYWVERLDGGMSRQFVLAGFTNSDEFSAICSRYSIERGKYESTEPRDKNFGVTAFAARCYTKALGRNFDVDGLNDWCSRILNSPDMRAVALDMASNGFFHSVEFTNKNTSNDEYVDILYRTFLGREADPAGKADWVGKLNAGVSRDEVMAGFSGSVEFDGIMKYYGL